MPSRDRRLKLLAKQQAEGGTAATEIEEPENVTIRKASAKSAKASKKKAAERNGDDHPEASIDETGESKELADGESATERSDGQRYLNEDFAPKKNKKIEKLAIDYEQKRDSRMAQGKLEVAARKLLIEALHLSKDELFKDESGRLIYKFPGEDKQVILDNTEKVSVKTVKSDDDEDVY